MGETRARKTIFGTVCVCVVGLAAFLGSGAPSAGAANGDTCSNAEFRTGPSADLPDCRAYELVSPLDKNGSDVMGHTGRTRASHDGDALQFSSLTAFGDARGTGLGVDYIARRTAAPATQGWATHSITPVQDALSLTDTIFGGLDTRYMGEFSEDFRHGVFLAKSPPVPAPNLINVSSIWLRDDLLTPGPGSYRLLSACPACTEPLPPNPILQPGLAGASADFSHLIFESRHNLTDDAVQAGLDEGLPKLYEWENGTIRLAGVLPDSACGSPPCLAPSSAAGRGAGARNVIKRYTQNTISSDGSRILFSSPVQDDSGGIAETDLYLRQDAATTVQVNAEERTLAPDPPSEAPAEFWAASADLSRIFFTTTEALVDGDGENSRDLYMYDADLPPEHPHNLTRIGVDTEPDDGTAGDVEAAIGASEDGEYVYFYSTNQLLDDGVAGETVDHCDMGDPCIFLWHEGTLTLVAHTTSSEHSEIFGDTNWLTFDPKASRLTPDGTRLLFLSDGTAAEPYDHGSVCAGAGSDGDRAYFEAGTPGCAELYLFDATANGGAGQLDCVSCNPSGVHATATEARIDLKTGLTGIGTSHLNRAVSDDGRFVFFATGEPLVPEDTNGAHYDVYRYDTLSDEPELVSGGDGPHDSFFLDAGADGHDVFIRTRQQLTGWDTDQQIDVYNARIGGGFPEPIAPPRCRDDGCQASPPPRPPSSSPASSGASGPGNLRPRRCARRKHRVRRNGVTRCVPKKSSGRKRSPSRADTDRRTGR